MPSLVLYRQTRSHIPQGVPRTLHPLRAMWLRHPVAASLALTMRRDHPLLTSRTPPGCLPRHDAQLCSACPVPPSGAERWSTDQKKGCSSNVASATNCKWGGVCVHGAFQNYCIDNVFGVGIQRFIAFEGCSAINQQWLVRTGVVGSSLYE